MPAQRTIFNFGNGSSSESESSSSEELEELEEKESTPLEEIIIERPPIVSNSSMTSTSIGPLPESGNFVDPLGDPSGDPVEPIQPDPYEAEVVEALREIEEIKQEENRALGNLRAITSIIRGRNNFDGLFDNLFPPVEDLRVVRPSGGFSIPRMRSPPPPGIARPESLPDYEDQFPRGIPIPEGKNISNIEAKPILLPCVVCKYNQIQTVNFPCMHATFCLECIRNSISFSPYCPQCRAPFLQVSMLYLCYEDYNIQPCLKKRKLDSPD